MRDALDINTTAVMVVVDATRNVDRQYNAMFVLEQLERAGADEWPNATAHSRFMVPALEMMSWNVVHLPSLLAGIEPSQLLLVLNKVRGCLATAFPAFPIASQNLICAFVLWGVLSVLPVRRLLTPI
jgi:hypothetical protein